MNDDQTIQNPTPESDDTPVDDKNQNTGSVILNAGLSLLDKIFDGATGRQMMLRVLVCVIIFLMALIWVKGDVITQAYKDSRYDTYIELLDKEKDKKFTDTANEQVQVLSSSSRADLAAIYSFRPKDLNYFVDMVAYQGILPPGVDPKNLGGYPIDKQSIEYTTHISGSSFITTTDIAYIPTRNIVAVKYMYSCPIFNLVNVYSGSIEMYWYDTEPTNEKKLFLLCNQTARILGRIR